MAIRSKPLRLGVVAIPLLLAVFPGCGCDDNEWTVHMVCTADGGQTLEPHEECVPCGTGPNQACTAGTAVAAGLSKAPGGCTQDGPPTPPDDPCSCS